MACYTVPKKGFRAVKNGYIRVSNGKRVKKSVATHRVCRRK